MHSSTRRLVLLGRSGFIAAALHAAALEKGWDVLALGRPELDLTEESSIDALCAQLTGSDCVLMLSALTPEHGAGDVLYQANIRMMQHAVAALERSGFAHLVYLSSDAVYPWTEGAVTEATPLGPQDSYGRMHAERETMARELGERMGKPVAILRPCAVHGPGDTHASYGPNRFLKGALESGELSLFGEGEEIRPHLWIGDCVAWVLEASVTQWDGTLNIVPRDAVSFRDLAGMISEVVQKPVQLRTIPRRQPVTHRRFDPAKREGLWPELPVTPLSASLRRLAETLQLA